jgi:hypothetical protein
MKFKTGDQVRALSDSSSGGFKKDGIYTVEDMLGGSVKVKVDSNGIANGWHEDNFELVKEEKVMKFAVGDQIIAIKSSSAGSFVKGHRYVVKGYYGKDVRVVNDSKGSTENGWHEDNFELIPAWDNLQILVDAANAGLKAIAELDKCSSLIEGFDIKNQVTLSDYYSPIETINKHVARGYLNGSYALRVTPKPAFEPFSVGQGWDVGVIGTSVLKVGCKKYNLPQMVSILYDLICLDKGVAYNQNGNFTASKTGIKDGANNSITWAEAEKLYNAIKDIK